MSNSHRRVININTSHVIRTDQSRFVIVDSCQNANSFKWRKLKYQGMTRIEIIIQILNNYYKNYQSKK